MPTGSKISWGSCPPSKMAVPEHGESLIEECALINARGGLEMLPWQKAVVEPWLAVDGRGGWAFPVVGNKVPRQNGKTVGCVGARAQYGMLKRWPVLGGRGERVIYTSHLQKTSTETFEFMASFFDSSAAMRRRVKKVNTAIGRERIVLKNGGGIKFLARTPDGGRGQHCDLLVYDEALDLTSEEKASFGYTVSASPRAQTIYTSTPPKPGHASAPYAAVRSRALSGLSRRTVWHEWGVDEVPPDDASADELLALARTANPSMGTLLPVDNILAEIESIEDMLAFAVERLGYWPPDLSADDGWSLVERADFEACSTPEPTQEGSAVAFGVKFSPDGSEVAVAACIGGERPRIELAEDRSTSRGTRWLRESMLRHPDATWWVDGRSGASALVEAVSGELGPRAHLASASDAAAASSWLLDAVREHAVVLHSDGADRLAESARASVRRKIGIAGGWGFGGDSAPVEAAALALAASRHTVANLDDMEVFF